MRFNGAGVAAIVGPNGCGKSNLSDAISWVLGEQSAKSLRGARMEDVIFAGTRDRKPMGMASVTMTLVDPTVEVDLPGAAQATGAGREKRKEVVITRRLYRSGESDYLIDGKSARLRDIQDIFLGTGLGPESYAIIEQGRIGQILSSRPQDRRAVIEEAAGITRFKTKKRLAEAKLEGAKQNLTRVFDILEEVTRHVNSLKRQAAKTERYTRLREELVGHLRLLIAGKYRILDRAASQAASELAQAAQAVEAKSAALHKSEEAFTALQQTVYQHEESLTARRKELSDLQIQIERGRGRLQSQSQQVAGIEQRLTNGESESQELEKRLGAMTGEVEKHRAALEQASKAASDARERLRVKNEERDALQGRLRMGEQGLEAARQQMLRLLGEASTLRNQLAQVGEYLASNERDKLRARKEEESAAADLTRLADARQQLQAKLSERQLQLESLVGRRKQVEEDLSSRRSALADARKQLEAVRAELSRLKARHDSLEEVLNHRTYTTDSVKRLFTAIEKGKTSNLKPAGVLADFIEVDPAYEKAAEELLREELEYVVVSGWPEAEAGIDVMRGDLDGRATFLVHPEQSDNYASAPPVEPPIGPETGIAGRLSDYLKMTNGLTKAPVALLPRLARCYLVQDRTAAQRLAAQYPDIFFLLPDGVCYHGHAVTGGRKTGAGPLALKRELRELKGLVQTRQRAFEGTQEQIAAFEHGIHQASEDLERLRQSQQREEKEALALDHEMRRLGEETNRSNARLSVARLELERLERESARAAAQKEEKQALLTQKDSARTAKEKELENGRSELEALRESVQRVSEEHSVLRVQLASLDERQRSENAARQRLEAQIGDVTRRRATIASEMERLGVDRARLLNDNMELDATLSKLQEEALQLTGVVNISAQKDQELRQSLTALDEALKQRRAGLQESQERRSQIEVQLVQLQSELKHLDENSRKDLNTTAAELLSPEMPELDEQALSELDAKHAEVRGRIEALGSVNPQALEELKEAEQRFHFLNAQRTDLLDSIRDTEKAIQEIDVESRKRFAEAFAAINVKFGEIFRTLFGGGSAEMKLTDESNIGESGIEMIASPPGKRLQNVLLLSGGEKSLTAMALLMAIFKYQPSPFCILDEVDAPLDEANTGRLAKLLKEMAAETQFIVITHAKRTMEAAQILYGVTMEEPGVSKLVSVKFNPQLPPQSPEPRRPALPA
jgi:chromosome segregation protein